MKRLIWLLVFFTSVPLTIAAGILLLLALSSQTTTSSINSASADSVKVLSTAIDSQIPSLTSSVTTGDARPLILSRYLRYHKSPLLDYSQKLVDLADKYNIDYRLIVAIARQESNLCKRTPAGSNNCWGYGIYGDNVVTFKDLLTGAEKEAKLLSNYKKSGLDTPEKIMARYTPPSAEGDGSWAKGVNNYLSELE